MSAQTDEQTDGRTMTREIAALGARVPDETPHILATAIEKYIGDELGGDLDVEGHQNEDGSIECVISGHGSLTFPTLFSFDEVKHGQASSIALTIQTGDDQADRIDRSIDELYENFSSSEELNEKVRSFYRHASDALQTLDEADAPENNKRIGALITIALQGAHELIQTSTDE